MTRIERWIMEIFKLILASYGALLSTGLLIYEIIKERKNIAIILEHVTWSGYVQIIVTNSGHRPITLAHMTMQTVIKEIEDENEHWEKVPQGSLFADDDPFPKTIKDGESIVIPLGSVLSEYLIENRLTAQLSVFDTEGKAYSKFVTREFDSRWGGYY